MAVLVIYGYKLRNDKLEATLEKIESGLSDDIPGYLSKLKTRLTYFLDTDYSHYSYLGIELANILESGEEVKYSMEQIQKLDEKLDLSVSKLNKRIVDLFKSKKPMLYILNLYL